MIEWATCVACTATVNRTWGQFVNDVMRKILEATSINHIAPLTTLDTHFKKSTSLITTFVEVSKEIPVTFKSVVLIRRTFVTCVYHVSINRGRSENEEKQNKTVGCK